MLTTSQQLLEMLHRQEQCLDRLQTQLTEQRAYLAQIRHGLSATGLEAQFEGKPGQDANSEEDNRYIAFEDRFRGSRAQIKERLKVYLRFLVAAGIGTPERPVLDVGCGRGEWLELLGERQFTARGLDTNRQQVDICRHQGSMAEVADALTYLRQLPAACLGAVTAFHVIEHLPIDTLVPFLDETIRVLQPGGLAILETPNPENLVVGACTFHIDLTHQRPLYPGTLEFLAQQRGLIDVEILRLSEHRGLEPLQLLPPRHALAPHLNRLIEAANVRLFGPPDYAVVGRKAM